MNRFNLTFSGEIVEGQDPELVKLRFANKFAIDDPARLARFFSGNTVILRRNLERKDAAQVYHELQLLGVVAALVKVPDSDVTEAVVANPPANPSTEDNTQATVSRTANGTLRLTKNAAAAHTSKDTVKAIAPAPWPADSTDIAAEIKARKLATQRLAAEKLAQEKAALEAQQREIDAAAAREQAQAAERQRVADEERARQAAEQTRLAAEEAARKAAEQAEARRVEAEEAARKTAAKAAAKRKAAEEAALRKAKRNREKAEKARQKAEEEARRKAEHEEKKRLDAEVEARRKAEQEEKKRLAAEEEARRKAALEEKKRLAAEEEARRKAALETKKRLAAEEARRQAAAEAEAAEDARLRAELAAQKQQEALTHNAAAASPSPPVRLQITKPAKGRVKTALEVPLRKKGETPEIGVPGQRKRVSGEPNLYKLRPFRNSDVVRKRAVDARQRMRRATTTAVLALAVLLIAGGSYLENADHPAVTGASAIGINANSEPLLLAGDVLLLHDRAGVGTTKIALSTLGVSTLEPPLAFAGEDVLYARGRLAGNDADSAQHDALQLLRCDLPLTRCAPVAPELADSHIAAFVLNPLDGSVLLADRTSAQLLKVDREGAVVARADVAIPAEPIMRLHGGLLLMNSAEGPAISVFRYEDDAFAQQLDEILPLPPSGFALAEARTGDFVWSGDAWWVNLRTAEAGPGELHRFDEEWNHRDKVTLAADPGSVQLVNWGEKTLVNDPRAATILRYNAQGKAEAPFASTPLQEFVSAQQQRAGLASAAWRGSLLLCALVALLAGGFAYWHGLRNLVYRSRREQGAEPLDEHAAALRWMEPVQNRPLQLRRTGIYYGLGVLAVLSLAIAVNVSVLQLAALLLACSGPVIALLLLRRQAIGYIGVLGDRLLLVDHGGLYHLAGGSRLQYRGPFLAIDDVVVFAGSRHLPAFSPAPLQQHVRPLALGGIKVDSKTIAIKLLECRHPLALGALVVIAAVAAAALLLALPLVF